MDRHITSKLFQEFAGAFEFEHITSSPGYPKRMQKDWGGDQQCEKKYACPRQVELLLKSTLVIKNPFSLKLNKRANNRRFSEYVGIISRVVMRGTHDPP